MPDRDVETVRASSGRELRRVSAVLHHIKESADAPVGHDDTEMEDDDETWADASEEDEMEVLLMTASCPMTPPESHFCFDGRLDSAFEALKN
jgi:hypothetical protein